MRSENGEILLGCFGRVSPNKYIESAILSIDLLRAQGIQASLLIVGELVDIRYYEKLLNLAQSQNNSNSIHFLGEVANEEYWQFLIGVDYLISLRDESRGGLSAVLTNGLFIGKTILASNIPEHKIVSERVHLINNMNAANEIFQKIVFERKYGKERSERNLTSNNAAVTAYMEALK
jgi:glycosyltransferase involved in cell wall biosynthesis